MKDAKGHGSNSRGGLSTTEQRTAAHGQNVLAAVNGMRLPRGTTAAYAGRDQLGRTYTMALNDHYRFPKQNPAMPNAEAYRTKVIPTRPAGDTNPFPTRTAVIPFGRRK